MRIPFFWIDAFSARAFAGNPAGVCPLDEWLPDDMLQEIAKENNLSETAYFVPRGDGFDLRWFTPEMEVDLCGHGTLASGKVVLDELRKEASSVHFHSRSGPLAVERKGDLLELDFPNQPGEPIEAPEGMASALGASPIEVLRSVNYDLAVFETQDQVAALEPNETLLLEQKALGLIATAPGDRVDFVSRFFAPKAGIFEDPVTGSAHCVSTPYWAERLGKQRLIAHQISKRGGELRCTLRGERVDIAGHAVLYMRGDILV
jgi:PhzF family phenazine biosynthesis protein